MVFIGISCQESRISLVGDKKANPHDKVRNKEHIVSLWQNIPCHWDTLKLEQLKKKMIVLSNIAFYPEKIHRVCPEKSAAKEK